MRNGGRPRPAWIITTLLVASGAACADPAVPPRASVLLITLDTTRADHLGCYGSAAAATPNIDRLAREGVRFEQALAPTPLTVPSHASLLTGLVPRRHGARDNALFPLSPAPSTLAEQLLRRGYSTAAAVSSAVLDRQSGLSRGFRHYDDTVRVGERRAFNYEERAASQTNQAALQLLERLEPPFLLWVHYFDPHLPYVPPTPFRERFATRLYDGEIAFVDQQLGHLLQAVRQHAAEQPLLVVVAGDHGEGLGEHGEQAHGVLLYQATQRVPLILAGHSVPRGTTVRRTVGLIDVAPTILDLLGLAALPGIDGRSLVPTIEGTAGADEAAYEMETLFPRLAYGWSQLHGIVQGKLKWIDAPSPELYDLATDATEQNNLAQSRATDAARLAALLSERLADDVWAPVELDADLAERRRQLESLGYVAGSASMPETRIDPKQGIRWLSDLERGRAAVQSGRPAEGIAPLRRLLARNPENVPALLTLGSCYAAAGKPADAVRTVRRALELRPEDDLVHFNLANVLAAAGDADAVRHYEETLRINPRRADAYLNFASLLVRRGELPAALALLKRADAAGVRDPDLDVERAVLELKRGQANEAVRFFRRAVTLNPYAADAFEALARLSQGMEHWAEAAGYYERLLELRPSAATAATLGTIRLERLDDPDGARRAFRRALELTPPDDPARERLAATLRELGEP